MDHALADLQSQADALWARAGCGSAVRLLPKAARQDACWYVKASNRLFRFVQWERGRIEPLTGWLASVAAVHWVLAGMAEARAQAEELCGRGKDGYSRWNWMAPGIAMMCRISPDHSATLERAYADVLTGQPLSEEERRAARYPLADQMVCVCRAWLGSRPWCAFPDWRTPSAIAQAASASGAGRPMWPCRVGVRGISGQGGL